MRKVIENQLSLGEVEISEIKFDPKSRDDIPQVLMGLQSIYKNETVRNQIFSILEKQISPETNNSNGRPGMELWKIFVMGVIRVNLNWDYDRLHEMVNNHGKIREMLGHGIFNEREYNLQTVKDNIRLMTPEMLEEINQVIVNYGHTIVKKKDEIKLEARADSFVVETNVHFPTDINLLYDAVRKLISLTANICSLKGITGWRQSVYNIKMFKKKLRKIEKKKHSTSKKQEIKEKHKKEVIQLHKEYINIAIEHVSKAETTQEELINKSNCKIEDFDKINYFIAHAKKQIELIERRVINEEIIPHNEKVFSLFEPHTEWICKGKRKVFVELGLNVVIIEDQHQFILNHKIMQKTTDKGIALPFIKETKKAFPNLVSCSFDKGFHSIENQEKLLKELDTLILPKKGKLSKSDQKRESSDKFVIGRKQHPAVESAINALEVHGLDKCPDRGIIGFKRYVGLAVVARNIQLVGTILQGACPEWWRKPKKYKKVA